MKFESFSFEKQVFFSSVRITVSQKSGQGASIGTGFVFQVRIDENSNQAISLLISNKHVYGDAGDKIIVNFNRRNPDDLDEPYFGEIITAEYDESNKLYTQHPDPNIDLACVALLNTNAPGREQFFKSINYEVLSDYSDKELNPGLEVWFVGYPQDRYDVVHNLPILRRGCIASIPQLDFNGNKQIVIDAPVFPGSSGSPVYALLGNKYKLIGVVTQTMIRHEQLQAIPTSNALGVEQVLGLGIVLKSTLVKELVDKAVENLRPILELAKAKG